MGTQLGNVTENYGHKHSSTVTNLNGENIMRSSNLLENLFIISAPQTINKEDIGTYSIFVTDSKGKPVRLSYTIQPGRGLVVGRNGSPETGGDGIDVLSMAIDDWSIKVDDPDYPEALYVNKENIIDNKTLMVVTPSNDKARIKVITDNLDHAGTTSTGFGIAKGDEYTIMTDDGILSVNTRNLDYADDESDTHGIIDANLNPYRTIRTNNGILSVWTQNLDRASVGSLGVVSPDGTYTFTNNDGVITVSNFTYAFSYIAERTATAEDDEEPAVEYYRYDEHGIVVPDLVTLGTYQAGELHVITAGLDRASESQFGVVKPDGISTGITSDGLLEVKQYAKLQAIMDVFDSRYTYILNKLNELEGRIVILETIASAENIELDVDSSVITSLTEPVWSDTDKKVISPTENISVELRVSTNCKFKVSVEYEDNVNPGIVLTQVKLGSNIVVTAAGLQDYEFDSTDDTISQLKLSFECSNYSSNTNEAKTSTVATIKISSMNDASIYKKAVHTFVRYNTSKYVKKQQPDPQINPDPDVQPTNWMPCYITELKTVNGDVYKDVARNATSSELINFNILGPYAKATFTSTTKVVPGATMSGAVVSRTLGDSWIKLSKIDTAYAGATGIKNKSVIDRITSVKTKSQAQNKEMALRWSYTTPQDIMPTLTNSEAVGYLGIDIEYSYDYTYTYEYNYEYKIGRHTYQEIRTASKLMTYTGVEPWLTCTLDSTYTVCNTQSAAVVSKTLISGAVISKTLGQQYNTIRLKSNKGITTDNRCANITFTYVSQDNEGNEVLGKYTMKYVETMYEKRPQINIVANLANKSPYLTLTATKSHDAMLKDSAYGKWGVTVGMKYVTADGKFANANGSTSYVEPIYYRLTDNTGFQDTLTMSLRDKPVVASNITACKVVDTYTASFTYVGGPEITYVTRNTWAKTQLPTANYSFGDATITKIKVNRWDDMKLTMQFDIVPGKTTNIPVGATINELTSTNDGKRMFRFFKGTSTYDWTDFYDTCTFTSDKWTKLGTTVYFTFTNTKVDNVISNSGSVVSDEIIRKTNETSADPSAAVVSNTISGMQRARSISDTPSIANTLVVFDESLNNYKRTTGTLLHEYPASITREFIATNADTLSNKPVLNVFGYIKFWFALNAVFEGIVTTTNFEVSTTGSSDKIGLNTQTFRYNISAEIPLSIVNGYYKTKISTSQVVNVTRTLDESATFAKSVEELRTSINELKTIENAAIVTQLSELTGTKITPVATTISTTKNTGITLSTNTKTLNTLGTNTKTLKK